MRPLPRHTVLFVLLIASAPAMAEPGPTGEPLTAADLTTIMKQLGPSVARDLDPKQDLDVTKIDLNGDKRPDYVVVSKSLVDCGSGGCAAWVLVSDGGRYRNVLPALLVFGITVADTRTQGVSDLTVQGRGDSPLRLTWDGKAYHAAPRKN
jgi:hypothetical protein